MSGTWRLALVAALAATACARPAGTQGPLPVVTAFATEVIEPGVPPTAVAVAGEPAVDSRQFTNDPEGLLSETRLDLLVAMPEAWTEIQNRAVLCRWTERTGLHTCVDLASQGPGDQLFELAGNAEPGETVEIWLADGAGLVQRRMFVGTSPPNGDLLQLHLAEGYATIDDVLTRQPPEGGLYLEPA